jgi:NAD(P)-dependent dehydrogenase (short-subunit alcohol dehydrogenase family)
VSNVNPVVVVTGVGPGTGAAIARRFAQGGYAVAMLARNRERLAQLEREIPGARAYPCDVTDEVRLDATIEAVRANSARRRCWSTTRSAALSATLWRSNPGRNYE